MISSLRQQLAASLQMLQQAVKTATNDVWISDQPPFWQHAFHISNSVSFYFSTFDPSIDKPNEQYKLPENIQQHAGKGFFDNNPEIIVSQDEVLEFLQLTRDQIRSYFDNNIEMQLDESSNFPWLPFNKYELILYNMRHIMEHTAILNQRLKNHDLPAAGWVGINEL